jgi:hypothetical protein
LVQIESDLLSDVSHLRQCGLQQRRLMLIPRDCDQGRDHIAVTNTAGAAKLCAEGNYLIVFEVFVPTVSEIVAAFLCRSRRLIAVDDADINLTLLVKVCHRPRKNCIKTALDFKPPKGAIDSGVVDLRFPALSVSIGSSFH